MTSTMKAVSPPRTIPREDIRAVADHIAQQFNPQKIMLFGSYARGEAHDYSDVDVIVVSPNFRKMGFMKRLESLSQMRTGKARTIAMDIVGYTSDEFAEMGKYSPHLEKIKKEARVVFP